MFRDMLLQFAGTGNGATGGVTSGSTTDSPTTGTQTSSNVLDLGLINGTPSSANGGGARDMGIQEGPNIKLSAYATAAFTGGTSLQLVLRGAPDNGSGAAGTYYNLWSSPVYTEAQLTAGAQLCNIDMPRVPDGQPLPRFLQFQYVTVGTHGAGSLTAEIIFNLDQQIISATNFYSGYPAGINVAN
jgi:hypothetical protein